MAQKPENTRKKVTKIQQGVGVTPDGVYGPKTRAAVMQEFRGPMLGAIKFAEGNPRNHGVLSIPVRNPEHASNIVTESTTANIDRFMRGQASNDNYDNSGTPRFVDFMQQRWAPIGSDTDKPDPTRPGHTLNENWAPNVRKYLQYNYPDRYPAWREMNLVKAPLDQFTAVA